MAQKNDDDFNWDPFIGRALAYLCLHLGEKRSLTVLEQAEFLMGMGLPRREAATVVGSSDDSLRVLARQKAKRISSKSKGATAKGE